MPDNIPEELLQQYLSASALFCPDLNTEGHTAHVLMSAIDKIRPSIIFHMAKIARDQEHFRKLVADAMMAADLPEEAEVIADFSSDTFSHSEALQASKAWLLVLLAAGQASAPDDEWTDLLNITKCVNGAVKAPTSMMDRLINTSGTQPVHFDPLGDRQ